MNEALHEARAEREANNIEECFKAWREEADAIEADKARCGDCGGSPCGGITYNVSCDDYTFGRARDCFYDQEHEGDPAITIQFDHEEAIEQNDARDAFDAGIKWQGKRRTDADWKALEDLERIGYPEAFANHPDAEPYDAEGNPIIGYDSIPF
tara:strand:+ start:143 stop:601 length:459 start_codon:yes stop_codon:yes gene_type:complete